MAGEQFSLCWDNFHKNMSNGMHALLENEDLVDVTIAVEGKYLKAHKMVLSVCSPYFKELFQTNPCKHPIVFMKDVSYVAMNDLLTFMYQGEVQVNQEHLTAFIKTAEALHIKGLTGDGSADASDVVEEQQFQAEEVTIRPTPSDSKQRLPRKAVQPAAKRPRLSSVDSRDLPAAEEIIQFKMEPCEPEQPAVHLADEQPYENLLDEAHGDNSSYREVTVDEAQLDDANIDDPEDYSMLESEDDPKPGTSNDADSQGTLKGALKPPKRQRVKSSCRLRFVVDGFVYHSNLVAGHPPLRYLGCSELKRLGCRARATLPVGGSTDRLKVTQAHNHPPDMHAEEKHRFLRELKGVVSHMEHSTLKHIYDTIAPFFPKAAEEIPFKSVCSSLHRWRKNLTTVSSAAEHYLVLNKVRQVRNFHKIVYQGFFYNISTTRLGTKRYYRCSSKKNTGCLGTAVLGKHDPVEKLCVLRPHNHPPDNAMEMKYRFEMELTKAVKSSNASIKLIYQNLASINPDAAKLVRYDTNLFNRLKRRRAAAFYCKLPS